MAISSTDITAGPYTTNGATTSFSFSFRVADYGDVEAEDMVKVVLVTASTGAETVLTRGVSAGQYTVSVNADQDNSPGGSITTVSTYASGYYIYVRLKPTFKQATELQNQGAYSAAIVEAQFDELQRQILDLRDQLRRAPVAGLQIGESFGGEITGTPVAGRLPVLNSGLTGFEWVANNGASTLVTATGSSAERSLAARFAEIGNVKDFGAVGDGIADDTAAIEAALAVWDSILIPTGVYCLGSRLDVPAGKKIYGDGFADTILRASATGYNGMNVGSSCVLEDFTIDGGSHGGSYSGILYDGVSNCYTDRVAAINWGADGFAVTNAAHHNKFGEIYATTNGSRGVLIDPNSYSNQFGLIDTRGSVNSGLLIGHNSYRNQIGLLICGGHQNTALWIHNAAYENQVNTVVAEAPASGYENNSAILFGWNATYNNIGSAIVTGWRRGVQFKGDDADPTYTDGDTAYNSIDTLYVTTDNGTNAAGVYLDANSGYFAKNNHIGKLHVKNATYGVWDTNGANTPNDWPFQSSTFESVTTPFSITEDIASASTTTLANTSGGYARITGTTGISSFGTSSFGVKKTLRFAASLTITHNGTSLILPGASNITTAADDTMDVVCIGGSNWLCTAYKKASGQPVAQVPIATGVSGLGTGIATFLATPSSSNFAAALTDETGTGANVFATSPTLVTPLLGTPTSGTLTNCTGLPISTGVSGLGTGIATFLATPSSVNLASALTDETGTGAIVFANSPTLVTPTLGTPTSGTLTNCTGYPASALASATGSYTPTLTSVSNVDSTTSGTFRWKRVGDSVTVWGKIDVDPTAGATLTQVGISLPVASNFGAAENAGGSFISNGGANGYGIVRADATNDRLEAFFVPGVNSNQTWYVHASYLII